MQNKFLILVGLFILIVPIVQAADVAYIVNSAFTADNSYKNAMTDAGLTYDIIRADQLAGYDMDNYKAILVNDDYFSNYNSIPVNDKPAVVVSSWHIDDWGWTTSISSTSSTNPLSVYVNNATHPIMNGVSSNPVQIYSSYLPGLYYMHHNNIYNGVRKIASLTNAHTDIAIGAAQPGDVLTKWSYTTTINEKTVFFGISEGAYWTADAKKMFQNSLLWVMFIDNDGDGYPTDTDCNDNDPDINPGETEILYNGKDDDCNPATADDPNAPIFLSVYSTPAQPYQNQEITINADIEEPLINSVLLKYSVDGGPENSVAMGLNGVWKKNIGSFSGGNVITYYVWASDNSGNEAQSSTYVLDVLLDNVPPEKPGNVNIRISNGDVILSWDSSEAGATYNIYSSATPELTGFDFNIPEITTGSLTWTDTPGNEQYYIIRAEDSFGNEEQNTDMYGKYTTSLYAGYNLVSLPLIPTDSSIKEVMHQNPADYKIDEIKTYASGNFQEAVYNPVTDSWTGDFSTMEINKGYFFKSLGEFDFSFAGKVVTEQQNIALVNGANLVGYTSLEQRSLSNWIGQSPQILEVAKRDDTSSYEISTNYGGTWWSASGFNAVSPGQGYWIKTNGATSLVYNP